MIKVDDSMAREFLRKRLDLELRGMERIKRLIEDAFSDLVVLGYPFRCSAEDFRLDLIPRKDIADKILSELRTAIYMLIVECEKSAVSLQEQCNGSSIVFDIEEFANVRRGDATLRERISQYVKRWKYEAEAFIAVGMATSMSASALMTLFRGNMKNPYGYSAFRKLAHKGFASTRLNRGGASFGQGSYISSVAEIERVGRYGVADAWRKAQAVAWKDTAVGFYVYRGSSYPCQICDDMRGFHAYNDVYGLPPYHANCKCYAVPIYKAYL